MNNWLSGSLIRLIFLFLPLSSLAQNDVTKVSRQDRDEAKMDTIFPVFIKIAANPQLKGNGFKKFLIGKNYRKEWIKPVQVAVINFKTAQGGLVPTRMGGGKETKSLRVENSTGKEWALRSIEKFPEKAVPPELRNTIAEKIVKDGISASYPFGALSMGTLSKAANVLFLKDTLVFVPDEPGLQEFRSKFRNTLVLMEEREPSRQDNDPGKKEKTISTGELIYKLANDNDNKVDQSAVLRARLLDNFVMDFDRHEGQWDWLGVDSAPGKIYYPVPIDRDQVFYLNRGLLSRFVSGKGFLPETQGFRKKAREITTFNKPEQNFDRFFFSGLSEDQWSGQIDAFLNTMTDTIIESALHQQPSEIQKYSVEKIISTLKKKRRYFKADMMRYYRFLSKTVSITGTNEAEQFSVSKIEDGKVSITVNKTDSTGNITSKLYERVFDPAITKEIRIYGLEGDDKFLVEGGESKIKIRLIGGPGNDKFINSGNARKVLAYDASFEQNVFSGDQTFRKRLSNDPQINNYTRFGYRYNKRSVGISLEYSFDGGLSVGSSLKIVKHGFRKEPYSVSHLLAVNRAINSSSWHIKYNADFIRIFGKTDLLIRADAKLPTIRTHFFGIGNNSLFDKTKPGGHKYYFARYDMVNISMMARENVNEWFQIKYGPIFQYFKLKGKENENKLIALVYPEVGTPKMQYAAKWFAGGELGFRINTKNDQLIPTRGVDLNIYGRSMAGLNNFSNAVTQAGADLMFYTDFISKKHVVIATSFGASHITGNYELEQAQYLGFKQNLRGFRIDRFGGRSRVYNNSEIRFIRSNGNLGLFRCSFGLLIFNDIGRVWADNEKSTQWHDGYGLGIWIAPLNRLLVSVSMMYSKEEKNLPLLNLGFQF